MDRCVVCPVRLMGLLFTVWFNSQKSCRRFTCFLFLNLCSILLRRLDVVIKSKHLQEDNKQINGESDLCFEKDSVICEAIKYAIIQAEWKKINSELRLKITIKKKTTPLLETVSRRLFDNPECGKTRLGWVLGTCPKSWLLNIPLKPLATNEDYLFYWISYQGSAQNNLYTIQKYCRIHA